MSRRKQEGDPDWARINAPNAVRKGKTEARLAAIVRRHGGTPGALEAPKGVVLPPVGKRECEGQTSIFDELGEPDPDDAGRRARKAQGDLT